MLTFGVLNKVIHILIGEYSQYLISIFLIECQVWPLKTLPII